MVRTRKQVLALLLAFSSACLLGARAGEGRFDAPPPGIKPTSASLDDVMARADAAGGADPGAMMESWRFDAGGTHGTERDVYAGDDYRITTQTGPFTYARGRRHGHFWRQNANGLTIVLSRTQLDESANGLWRSAQLTRDGARLLGEVASPGPSFVVQFSPKGGPREWLFIDKATARITRAEIAYPNRRVIVRADDFRECGGTTRAGHLHLSDTLSKADDVDWRLTGCRTEAAPDVQTLDIPPNARTLDRLPDGVSKLTLPARFIDSHVYLRAMVDGRPAYFMLDSGTSDIVLDRAFARSLGLKEYAQTTAVGAGRYQQAQVRAKTIRIGRLTLRDVAAYSVPFHYRIRDVAVVGLLGYDFFADAVVHVDYFHERVELTDQSVFDSAPLAKQISVGLALDGAVPVARVRVGSSAPARFVVDTGSSDVVIFSHYARAHPADVADAGGGAALSRFLPLTASAIGGTLHFVPIELRSFSFARNVFHVFMVQRLENSSPFESQNADGLIGYEFLHYFDLYFDYENRRLVLVPNPWLQRAADFIAP